MEVVDGILFKGVCFQVMYWETNSNCSDQSSFVYNTFPWSLGTASPFATFKMIRAEIFPAIFSGTVTQVGTRLCYFYYYFCFFTGRSSRYFFPTFKVLHRGCVFSKMTLLIWLLPFCSDCSSRSIGFWPARSFLVIFPLSLVTVPEVFAKVNSSQFPSRIVRSLQISSRRTSHPQVMF